MGILNVTPDSFSDGDQLFSQNRLNHSKLLSRINTLSSEGVDIIDVGGESTRPGAMLISTQEELERVIPAVEFIQKTSDILISVDTSNADVMKAAIAAGAHVINDVRAFSQPNALDVVATSDVGICIMHMQGTPQTMQNKPAYENVTKNVFNFLTERVNTCLAAGITADRLMIDPGFGFGKTLEHNLQLMRELESFKTLQLPILIGVSRKRMIGDVLNKPVGQRLYGGLGLAAMAIINGANIIRTHDVGPTVDVIKMMQAVIKH